MKSQAGAIFWSMLLMSCAREEEVTQAEKFFRNSYDVSTNAIFVRVNF